MSTILDAPATGTHRLLPAAAAGGGLRERQAHERHFGPLPTPPDLVALTRAAGLTGRGGAGFPTWRKLATAAAARRPVVVGNAAEGEPASAKDALLLALTPHLVLDGLELAAHAVGAGRAYLYVREDLADRIRPAAQARGVEVVAAPQRFLAGQETAVAAALSGRPALPTSNRVYERGVRGRPTLVQNVETLAHLALLARYGPHWFRSVGTADEPGSLLCTVSGDVGRPGVVEAAVGSRIGDVLAAAGGPTRPPAAVLVGGYHGAWLAGPDVMDLELSTAGLAGRGANPGAGVLVALGEGRCGLVETARAVRYLADQSAHQCGPCSNGLPALAGTLAQLAAPARSWPPGRPAAAGGPTAAGHPTPWWPGADTDPAAVDRVDRLTVLLEGRGGCHHPDGAVRFVRSALVAFDGEVRAHLAGDCTATDRTPLLPAPGSRP